jgi:hypothetical protein
MIKSICFILLISICQSVLADEEVDSSFIGHDTVAAALVDLKAKKDAAVSEKGWPVIQLVDGENSSTWSFAPASHPAYPALF